MTQPPKKAAVSAEHETPCSAYAAGRSSSMHT